MKTLLVITILIGVLFLSSGCIEIGSGTAVDTIARVSYEGLIWKTWRVELTNDHPLSDGNGGTITQRYGVSDEALAHSMQDYEASGQKVKLYYRSELLVWPWEYSDSEIVFCVQPANQTGGPTTCR